MTILFKQLVTDTNYTTLNESNKIVSNINQYSGFEFKYTPTIPGHYSKIGVIRAPEKIGSWWKLYEEDPSNFYKPIDGDVEKIYTSDLETTFDYFFNDYGKYILKFDEYTESDVLHKSQTMFFEIKSLATDITPPYPGEGYEFDDEDGWAGSLNDDLRKINGNLGNRWLMAFGSDDEVLLGDVVGIDFETIGDSELLKVKKINDGTKTNCGVVIKIFENGFIKKLDDKIHRTNIYVVALQGMFRVSNITIDTDTNNKIYYNHNDHTLDSDTTQTYVGRFYNSLVDDGDILLIENPLSILSNGIDIEGSQGSLIVKGTMGWDTIPIGKDNEVLKVKDNELEWEYTNSHRIVFINNSCDEISEGDVVALRNDYYSIDSNYGVIFGHEIDLGSPRFEIDSEHGLSPTNEFKTGGIETYKFVEGLITSGVEIELDELGSGRSYTTDVKPSMSQISVSLNYGTLYIANRIGPSNEKVDVQFLNSIDNTSIAKGELDLTDGSSYKIISFTENRAVIFWVDNDDSKAIKFNLINNGNISPVPLVAYNDIPPVTTKIDNLDVHIIGERLYISFIRHEVESNPKHSYFVLDYDNMHVGVQSDDIVDIRVFPSASIDGVKITSSIYNNNILFHYNYDSTHDVKFVTVMDKAAVIPVGAYDLSIFTDGAVIKDTVQLNQHLIIISLNDDSGNGIYVAVANIHNPHSEGLVVGNVFYGHHPISNRQSELECTIVGKHSLTRVDDNQFAITYLVKHNGTYSLRMCLGEVHGNEVIWGELTEPLVHINVNDCDIVSISTAVSDEVLNNDFDKEKYIYVNCVLNEGEVGKAYVFKVPYVKNKLMPIGIAEDSINVGDNGVVCLSGVCNIVDGYWYRGRQQYYTSPIGKLTDRNVTDIRIGTVINNSKLLVNIQEVK